MPWRPAGRLVTVTAAVLALCPSLAWAHTQLLSTSPTNNAIVASEPSVVRLTFNEPVGIDGDAARVFDRDGRRVDTGVTFHPGGRGRTVAIRLHPDLPHGTYTATYRVVSADTHVVTGGFVFSIGARGAGGSGTVNHLLAGQRAGAISDTAFAITRGVQYAAIAVAFGLFAFLLFVWTPALQRAGLAPDVWRAASERYIARVRTILAACCGVGAVSALVGIVLQGVEARGVTFWQAIDATTLNDVLPTRFGIVWGAGLIAWLAALLAIAATLARPPATGLVPRTATLGATGVVLPAARSRVALAVLAVPLGAHLALPALAGHATIQHPVVLFAPVNVIHVAAMSMWLGGLVGLLVGGVTLPAADDRDRAGGTRVLAAALERFSPIALICVATLIATGVVQALIEVSAWSQLIDTAYGRAIVVKSAAVAVLIGLGARQRRKTIPAVIARADQRAAPSTAARLLVGTLAAELAVLVVVLAAVGSLAGSAPARDDGATNAARSMREMGATPGMAMASSPGGPARTSTTIGAAKLAISVTPATVGENAIELTLTDARTGRPFTATKQLTVTANLPRNGIGPLTLDVHPDGPGRYAAAGAVLGTPGTWTLQITNRTSKFDQSERAIRVLIN